MDASKFAELWEVHAKNWYRNECFPIAGVSYHVSDFCELQDQEYVSLIHQRYETIKKKIKKLYFKTSEENTTTISPFKRAAIIVYAVNSLEPLVFIDKNIPKSVKNRHSLFLKQKLAFHLGLMSIVMEYPKEKIEEIAKQGNIFDFDIKSIGVGGDTGDSFLRGVYKDILFSDIYKNYNVITMSNVFLLIVERSSKLKGLLQSEQN